MENNYLITSLIKFFQKIECHKGHLLHIESDLNHFYKTEVPRILKILDGKIGEKSNQSVFKFSGLNISDISAVTDNGAINYYPLPTKAYVVTHDNYKEQINNILIYVRNLLLSQSYDALETFFKDITIEYCKNNEIKALHIVKSEYVKKNDGVIDWKKSIRDIKSSKNNDKLLSLIRNLNPTFKLVELTNSKGIDLVNWYRMFSEVRHSVVHSQSILSSDKFYKLNTKGQKALNEFISLSKDQVGNYSLKTTNYELNEMIKIICEYAFQIFKGYSMQCGLEWRILLHMTKNEA